MKQFFEVFKFEFAGFLKGKWFRVSTILICVLVTVVMFVPRFIDINNKSDGVSTTSETIGIYDPNHVFEEDNLLKQAFPEAKFVKQTSDEDMKAAVKKGELDSGISVKDDKTFDYQVLDTSMNDMTMNIFTSVMEVQYKIKMLSSMGLSEEQIANVVATPIKGGTVILGKDGRSNYFYTYIMIFAMYFVIIFYGQMTATNVASEKGNRSMEILITSTSTNALIFGKVLAGAAASILQVGVMLGVSIMAYQYNADIWNHTLDFLFNIPVNVLLSFALFGTLGYLFYTFIYGAMGSMVSKVEEVSSAVSPITIIFVIAFFITFFSVMVNPGTILSTIASYVPFTSCMAMFARVAMGSVELWQIILSAVILAVSTAGVGLLGAKLYRNGTLSYGNNFKISQIFKNLKHKD